MPAHLVAALADHGITPYDPLAALLRCVEACGLACECSEDWGDGTSRYPLHRAVVRDLASPDTPACTGWGRTDYRDAVAWALARFLVASDHGSVAA